MKNNSNVTLIIF